MVPEIVSEIKDKRGGGTKVLPPFLWCAQHGRSLTGESPECGLIVPST